MRNEQSKIDITSGTHRGYGYGISICNPKADWGEQKGKFTIKCAIYDGNYYTTLGEAESAIKTAIDKFLEEFPKDWDGWYELVEGCMIWSGYEDCELDGDMLKSVMNRYAKFINKKGEQ